MYANYIPQSVLVILLTTSLRKPVRTNWIAPLYQEHTVGLLELSSDLKNYTLRKTYELNEQSVLDSNAVA